MRPIKKRARADNIPNEKRVMRGKTGRTVYLALLFLFGLAIFDYTLGDYIFLDADGLVLSDSHIVATPYVAQVSETEVGQGQAVKAGDVLVRLQSTEILERLADLSTKRAGLVARATDFKIRAERVQELLPLAERRATEATDTIKKFDALANAKLVTSVRYQEALRINFEASRDRVGLLTQQQVLSEELSSLDGALRDADDATKKLKALYADGVVRSPVDGYVGASAPSAGKVFRPGEPIMSVHHGETYVLAYLPERYLFPIKTGMSVHVHDGRERAAGVITEILPVTDALPEEFQNTFEPSDRSQLAKIKLEGPTKFPMNQKVSVSR